MEIELRKLKCEKELLLGLAKVVKSLHGSTIYFDASSHTLTMESYNDVQYTARSSFDHVAIRVPYLGPEYRCYGEEKLFSASVAIASDKVLVKTRGKPLAWLELEGGYSFKKLDRIKIEVNALNTALDFLLRPDPEDINITKYKGLVFNVGEVLFTDSMSIHGQFGLPQLVKTPELFGIDATFALQETLKVLQVSRIGAVFSKKSRSFSFLLEDNSGIEVYITSRPIVDTDGMDKLKPLIGEQSLGFTTSSAYVEQICSSLLSMKKEEQSPVVEFAATDRLHYRAILSGERTEVVHEADLPLNRLANNYTLVKFALPAKQLLRAVRGLGDTSQFIVADLSSNSPVYVNCNGNQYALIARCMIE
jgi:hypothetical protein